MRPDNSTEGDDSLFLYIDLNNNGTIDFRLHAERSGWFIFDQFYYDNCSAMNWAYTMGNAISPLEPNRNHTMIEMVFAINRSVNYSGQNLTSATQLPLGVNPFKILFGGYGTLSPQWLYGNSSAYDPDYEMFGPPNNYNSSNLAEFQLLDSFKPPGLPSFIPGFDIVLILFEFSVLVGISYIIKSKRKKITHHF